MSAALIAAERAEHAARCIGVLGRFDAHSATTAAMQAYAGCVDFLYPAASGAPPRWCILALVLASLGGGAAFVMSTDEDDWAMKVLCGLVGAVMAPTALGAAGGLIYGLLWGLGVL